MAIRVNYTNELNSLVNDVRVVGAQLEETFNKVIKNLDDKDVALAKSIRKDDKIFNEKEHNIMQKCSTLVLTQAPVATDWREIASIMEMIIDIERIADHCSDISKYTAVLSELEDVEIPDYFASMIEATRDMLKDCLVCFSENNADLAKKIIERDEVVDKYFSRYRKDTIELIKENPDNAEQYIDYLLIAKYIERIADHTTNIAEWVIYIAKNELK